MELDCIDEGDLVDESDLIDEDEETPRERKRRQLAEALPRLNQLVPLIPKMATVDRLKAMKMIEDAEKLGCELSFATFFKCAWRHLDPAEYVDNWHIHEIADAAERIVTGECRRLIVNQPPRTSKSTLLAVAFPAWVWIQSEKGPLSGPQVQFMYASYAQALSFKHSADCRKLILSGWFQKHWGDRFKLVEDRNAIGHFENTKGGCRIATSVGAAVTGFGADIIGIDDPSNTQDITSEAERQSVINWYTQSLSTRLNNPKTGAMLLVQQRQHREDLTGYLLDNEPEMWENRVFKMRYESNPFLDYDPRGYDEEGNVLEGDALRAAEGALLWPERTPEDEVAKLEKTLGSFGAAGQLQQRPMTKGGGYIRDEHWQVFPPEDQKQDWVKDGIQCWPPFEFVLASADLALSEKDTADYSALTIWGLWHDKTGAPKISLVHAWHDRLSFNPMITRIGNNCRKFKPDVLLIEAKAAGISAAQEIQRVYGSAEWTTQLINPRGDKVSRVIAIQGLFEEKLISAPDKVWAQLVIDECSDFPAGKHDDLVDSMSQALLYFRMQGLIKRRDEYKREVFEAIPRPGDPALTDALPYDV